MTNKILIISGLIGLFLLVLFLIYKEGEKKGEIKEIKKQQEIEIKIQDEVIEESKQIIKRKQINKSKPTAIIKDKRIILSDSDTNLGWLYQNRCKDCKSR